MSITVNQLLKALQHSGLSGDDKITVRNISGDIVDANVEVGSESEDFLIRLNQVQEIESLNFDCDCGDHGCHYCGG